MGCAVTAPFVTASTIEELETANVARQIVVLHGDIATDNLSRMIERVFAARPEFVAGEPWYQGDHGLFLMTQRPALALTSDRVYELMTPIVHSVHDRPDILDVNKLVEAALALRAVLERM